MIYWIHNNKDKNMSTKQNDSYYQRLREELIKAIESGDRVKELNIRDELKDAGYMVLDELDGYI